MCGVRVFDVSLLLFLLFIPSLNATNFLFCYDVVLFLLFVGRYYRLPLLLLATFFPLHTTVCVCVCSVYSLMVIEATCFRFAVGKPFGVVSSLFFACSLVLYYSLHKQPSFCLSTFFLILTIFIACWIRFFVFEAKRVQKKWIKKRNKSYIFSLPFHL